MYNTLEFFKMLRLLQADLHYSRMKDPEEKMRYFVRKHYSSIIKYIKNSMKILSRSVERNKRLDIDIIVPEWEKVYVEHAQALYMDCSVDTLQVNNAKILEFCNEVIGKVSFTYDDKDSLYVLSLYIGMRALTYMICGDKDIQFKNDVRHLISLVNELSYEFLIDRLADKDPMIKMFLQLAFILQIISFSADSIVQYQIHEFVEGIKQSVHDYSVALDSDSKDLVRTKTLDDIVLQLSNEYELEERLNEDSKNQNWKVFVELFELCNDDFDYNSFTKRLLEMNNQLHDKSMLDNRLMNDAFKINDKVILEATDYGGRCYVADSHIQVDESILVEKPISCVIFQDYFTKLCSSCQKNITTPFPCCDCTEMPFCSLECSKVAKKQLHWLECGCYSKIVGQDQFTIPHAIRLYSLIGVERILSQIQRTENEKFKLVESLPKKSSSQLVEEYIDEFQCRTKKSFYEEGDRDTLCNAIDSLLVHRWSRQTDREIIHSIWALNVVAIFMMRDKLPPEYIDKHNLGKFASLLELITCRLLSICTNGFGWLDILSPDDEYLRLGSSICFVGSFFNHSCKPNVTWTITKENGLQMQALRTIQPREPLCISYGPRHPTPFNERQKALKENYCFLCRCELCLAEASEAVTTLNCLNPQVACDGPLVLNRHHSCLKCGYKASYIEYSLFSQKLYAHRKQFEDLFKKLQFKNGKSDSSFIKKIQFHTTGALRRKTNKIFLNLKGILQNTSYSYSTIDRLKREFTIIQEIGYKHSFHLLEQCSQLIKVLQWENVVEDYSNIETIHNIMKSVWNCLENAHSDEVLSSEIGDGIVKNTEFCSEFFHHYIHDFLVKRNHQTMQQNACELLKRIDLKLVQILKPIAYNYSNSRAEDSTETLKDRSKSFYLNMFMNAQKRILTQDDGLDDD